MRIGTGKEWLVRMCSIVAESGQKEEQVVSIVAESGQKKELEVKMSLDSGRISKERREGKENKSR